MKKVLTGLLVAACSLSIPLLAQNAVPLVLEEAIASAINNNSELILASLDEQQADAKFKQTSAVFLPQLKVSYTALTTSNPLNAFGFKLQQESITPADFNPELLNDPSATQNFMTKATWEQPILNMDMVYLRKAAHEQRAIYAFKSQRATEYLVFEVQKAYAQLQLAWQANAVAEEAVQTISAIYSATNNRFEKGLLQKSDVLNVQVQVAATESQVAMARSNIQNASDYLSLLMGTATGTTYQVKEISGTAVLDSVRAEVPATRADFQAMQSAVSAQSMMMKSAKMAYLPRVNGFAEFLINDKEAFGFGASSYLAGAQLSWTVFNGTATQNKIAQQRIERDKSMEQLKYQKQQSQLELNKTLRQREDALISVKQYETAVNQASEALRILQNRYQQGLVTTNDILQSQTALSQQKLNYAQALFVLNTAQAYLQFLTSTEN